MRSSLSTKFIKGIYTPLNAWKIESKNHTLQGWVGNTIEELWQNTRNEKPRAVIVDTTPGEAIMESSQVDEYPFQTLDSIPYRYFYPTPSRFNVIMARYNGTL